MTWRRVAGWGVNPYVALALIGLGYLFVSETLFKKTDYAPQVLIVLMLTFQMRLLRKERNEFLEMAFLSKRHRLIRIIENLLIASPFLISMLVHRSFIEALVAVVISIAITFTSTKTRTSWVMPTPFGKRPFEFTVGFRNSYLPMIGAYALLPMAYAYHNSNWGIVSLVFLTLIILGFFSKPEHEMYVWNYAKTPPKFLFSKAIQSLRQASLLIIPLGVILLIIFPENSIKILSFTGLALAYIILIIMAKYSAYPEEMNIPQGILIGMTLYFPPLLVVVIPYFYFQAIQKLQALLK